MSTSATIEPAAPGLTNRARTISLCVVLLAFFMDLLDATIVNIAIPSIQRAIGASYSVIQWVIAGYSLAFAAFLITGGRLGDIFGYRRLFLVGIAGFTAASCLCGLAGSSGALIAARLLQGLMAALMVPQILSIIQVMYTSHEERQGISAYYGALAGVATVAGPILGALLVASNAWGLGWRSIFLVNLPVGVLAIVLAARHLPDTKSSHPLRIDMTGVLTILLAMTMLMYPLIQGRDRDWPRWMVATMILSLPLFVLFGWSQVRKERRDGSPLVVPHLFHHRSFVAGIVLMGTFFAVVSGFLMIFTIFLQIGLGFGVLKAGLTGVPFSLGVSVASAVSNPLILPRFGRRSITAGPLIMASGFALSIATIRHFGDGVTPWEMAPSLATSGIGMGLVVASVYPFILAEVRPRDAGSASGVVNAVGQVGGAMGIALFGTLFFGLVTRGVESPIGQGSPESDVGAETIFLTTAERSASVETDQSLEDPFEKGNPIADAMASSGSTPRSQPEPGATPGGVERTRAAAVEGPPSPERASRLFRSAMESTLEWLSVALLGVALMTLFLPARPGALRPT